MLQSIIIMVGAALLETGGDAMIRHGLTRQWIYLIMGAASLVVYGVLVNQGALDFSRLMGCYIAIFFIVSQIVAYAFFAQIPGVRTVIGGLLIIVGGLTVLT